MKLRDVATILALSGALAACTPKIPGAPQATPVAPVSTALSAAMDGAPSASRSAASTGGLGERIYSGNCVPCHQQSGAGIPGVYPSLAGSPVVLGDPAELARWVIKGQRPATMPAGRYSTQMLQFGWMKPAQAAALLSYLRLNLGNSATSVDAAAVARALGQ